MTDLFKVGDMFFIKQDPSTLERGAISKVRPFVIVSRYIASDVTYVVLAPCSTKEHKINFFGNTVIAVNGIVSIVQMGQAKKLLVMREEKLNAYTNKVAVGRLDDVDILEIWSVIDNKQTAIDPVTGQVRGHKYFAPAHSGVKRLYEEFDILNILNVINA